MEVPLLRLVDALRPVGNRPSTTPAAAMAAMIWADAVTTLRTGLTAPTRKRPRETYDSTIRCDSGQTLIQKAYSGIEQASADSEECPHVDHERERK